MIDKNHPHHLILALLTGLFPAAASSAQVPETIHYQGKISVGGEPFTGTGSFKFALVDDGSESVSTASATANVTDGLVTSYNLIDGGNGYGPAPDVTITGGGGSGATATAVVENGAVTAINRVDTGDGYTSTPDVTIAAPPAATIQTVWSNDGSGSGGGEPGSAISLTVSQGVFSVNLGDLSLDGMSESISAETLTDEGLRLRVWFDDGSGVFQQLEPDQALASVPYALTAGVAENVAEGAVSFDQVDPEVALWTQDTTTGAIEYLVANQGILRVEPGLNPGFEGPMITMGFDGNEASAYGATVSGGGRLGAPNLASAGRSTVGGGENNTASGSASTVGGGSGNTASGNWSLVGGGDRNTASRGHSTVGGGIFNTASGEYSAVGGGRSNTASGTQSTVPGGSSNDAAGSYSFAAGRQAKVGEGHDGTFVWADSTDSDFKSTGEDQFLIRAGGGVGIGTDSPEYPLHVNGTVKTNGDAVLDGDLIIDADDSSGFAYIRFRGTSLSDPDGPRIFHRSSRNRLDFRGMDGVRIEDGNLFADNRVGINTIMPDRDLHIRQSGTNNSSIGLQIERGGSSTNNWAFYIATSDNLGFRYNDQLMSRINASDGEYVVLSDKRMKTDIEPLGRTLDNLLRLSPSSYFMKHDASRDQRSIGLIAQDVMEIFPSAVSKEEGIYGVSYGKIGVFAVRAIQEQQEIIESQESRIAELEAQIAGQTELESRLERLEGILSESERVSASD